MPRRVAPIAFVLGVAVGSLATWWALGAPPDVATSEDAATRSGREARPTAFDGEAPGLASGAEARHPRASTGGATGGATGAASRPARADAPAAIDVADDLDEGAEVPTIEVLVAGADGVPEGWTGTAYALPAAARGNDAEHGVAHVAVSVGVPARLRVPAYGRYDVGVLWAGAHVLVEDVAVTGPAPVRADVALPACAPVRIAVDGEGPRRDGAGKAVGEVRLVPHGDGPARAFPGRGERPLGHVEVSVDALPGAAASAPLPTTVTYEVEGDVVLLVTMDVGGSDAWLAMGTDDERLVATPKTVRGGGEVRLVREGLGAVTVTFRVEPATWPTARLRARLRWFLPGDPAPWDEELDVRFDAAQALSPKSVRAPPGAARVSWEGMGLVPGEATVTVGGPGSTTETEVVLRHDPAAGAQAGLPLDLTTLPPGAGPLLAVGWGDAGFRRDERGRRATEPGVAVREEVAIAPRDVLGAGWRRARGVMFVAGDQVSAAASPPVAGDWKPALERGGYVAVVPDPNPDPALGTLNVRRADGVPLLSTGGTVPSGRALPRPTNATTPTASLAVGVVPGTMLGPFPAGEVALEPRLGAVPLPPATLVVRAGRVTTWTLRWRR